MPLIEKTSQVDISVTENYVPEEKENFDVSVP